jgi:hypothetical protein
MALRDLSFQRQLMLMLLVFWDATLSSGVKTSESFEGVLLGPLNT